MYICYLAVGVNTSTSWWFSSWHYRVFPSVVKLIVACAYLKHVCALKLVSLCAAGCVKTPCIGSPPKGLFLIYSKGSLVFVWPVRRRVSLEYHTGFTDTPLREVSHWLIVGHDVGGDATQWTVRRRLSYQLRGFAYCICYHKQNGNFICTSKGRVQQAAAMVD